MHTLIIEANKLLVTIDRAVQYQMRNEKGILDYPRYSKLRMVRRRAYERLVRRLNKYFPVE